MDMSGSAQVWLVMLDDGSNSLGTDMLAVMQPVDKGVVGRHMGDENLWYFSVVQLLSQSGIVASLLEGPVTNGLKFLFREFRRGVKGGVV